MSGRDQVEDDPDFTIQMLPAGAGDCLWIEYGPREAPWRILVDGGQKGYAGPLIAKLDGLGDAATFELIVVTHVHDDHIGGILEILGPPRPSLIVGDFWFNDLVDHPIVGPDSYEQGNRLAKLIGGNHTWNGAFGGHAVAVGPDGDLPTFPLAGGMSVTVLGPTQADVKRLRDEWKAETLGTLLAEVPGEALIDPLEVEVVCPPMVAVGDQARLAEHPSVTDDSIANRSSIVLVLDYAGRRVLLTGDSHADVIREGLERLNGARDAGRPIIQVVKLPHHGSRRNNDGLLFAAVESDSFLVSTNGLMRHCHPNPESIARLTLAHPGCRVIFNERSIANEIWTDEIAAEWQFTPEWPVGGVVDVMSLPPLPQTT